MALHRWGYLELCCARFWVLTAQLKCFDTRFQYFLSPVPISTDVALQCHRNLLFISASKLSAKQNTTHILNYLLTTQRSYVISMKWEGHNPAPVTRQPLRSGSGRKVPIIDRPLIVTSITCSLLLCTAQVTYGIWQVPPGMRWATRPLKTAHDRHLARSSLTNSSGICMRTKHFAEQCIHFNFSVHFNICAYTV